MSAGSRLWSVPAIALAFCLSSAVGLAPAIAASTKGPDTVADTAAGDVRDAVIIASANRVEHYEIAAYGVAKAFAGVLDFDDDVKLLDETLDEESKADKTITKIATGGLFTKGINKAAA
ncbi:MAG: DUF892 family protein [Geovibrio sp.]|nr:DUF892 family protein [Geovibrio sp.]